MAGTNDWVKWLSPISIVKWLIKVIGKLLIPKHTDKPPQIIMNDPKIEQANFIIGSVHDIVNSTTPDQSDVAVIRGLAALAYSGTSGALDLKQLEFEQQQRLKEIAELQFRTSSVQQRFVEADKRVHNLLDATSDLIKTPAEQGCRNCDNANGLGVVSPDCETIVCDVDHNRHPVWDWCVRWQAKKNLS